MFKTPDFSHFDYSRYFASYHKKDLAYRALYFLLTVLSCLFVIYFLIPKASEAYYLSTVILLDLQQDVKDLLLFSKVDDLLFFDFNFPKTIPSRLLVITFLSVSLFITSLYFFIDKINTFDIIICFTSFITIFNALFFFFMAGDLPYLMNGMLSFFIYMSFSWWFALPILSAFSLFSIPTSIWNKFLFNFVALFFSSLFCLLRYIVFFYVLMKFSVFFFIYFFVFFGIYFDFYIQVCLCSYFVGGFLKKQIGSEVLH